MSGENAVQDHGNPKEPHVFVEYEAAGLGLLSPHGLGRGFPALVPPGKPTVTAAGCAVCHKARTDQIHIDGQSEADAESPHWGM